MLRWFKRFLTARWVIYLLLTAGLVGGTALGAAAYRKAVKRIARERARAEVQANPIAFVKEPTVAAATNPLDPGALSLAPDVRIRMIRESGESAKALGVLFPVNIVHRGEERYYVCNYKKLYLIDLAKGVGQEVPVPAGLATPWVPTGLFWDAPRKTLYVASYTSHNVLVLDAADEMKLKLAASITHPDMKGPEGVALSADGQHLAVADYDGHALFLFTSAGKLLWKYTALTCHGVDIYRAKDGRQYVVGTSLGQSAVIKLDFSGKLLRQVSNPIWHGGHGYLYPTAVMTRPDGLIAITDAFRGQVSFLDEDLEAYGVLGGNGPGPGLFNNPYGSCWAGSDRVLVADTFRDRLVEVSLKTRCVTSIYYLEDPAARKSLIAGRFDRESELAVLIPAWSVADPGLINVEPFGKHHQLLGGKANVHVDLETTVALPLPHFNKAVRAKLGENWHPGIQGLVCAQRPDISAWCLGMTGLFTDYPLRFLYVRTYQVEGETYLLLGSPHSQDVLVCGRGATVAVPLRKDTWMVGDTLIGRDFALPARRVVQAGAQRIQAFLHDRAPESPLEAIRAAVFPKWTRQEFQCAFVAAMRSPEGIAFAQECWQAPDANAQRAAAERYLASCPDRTSHHLAEILLAEMMLCERK